MDMSKALSGNLLADTAGHCGNAYLQQLVQQLHKYLADAQIWLAVRVDDNEQSLRVTHSSHPMADSYACHDTPCERVRHACEPVLLEETRHPLQLAQCPCHYLGLPLLDQQSTYLGHLAILYQSGPTPMQQLVHALQPFLQRAAAELQAQTATLSDSRQVQWHRINTEVLRHHMRDGDLPETWQLMIDKLQQLMPEWMCTLLLLDEQGCMQPRYGPALPEAYHQLIRGMMPGEMVGSCGAAIWGKQRVIAEDIASHPNWAAYLPLISQFNLGSCWSEPIIDSKGKVHGSFAVYHNHPAHPDHQAISLLEDCAQLLALLLENDAVHRQLESRSQWYRAIMQNAADGLSIIDLHGRFLEVSDSLCQMLGYNEDELLQMDLWQVVPGSTPESMCQRLAATGEDGETFESVNRTKSGELIDIEVSARRLILDGQPVIWGAARDISQRKTLQRILERQATVDSLTGLLNRQTLMARLESSLAITRQGKQNLSVLLLDIDHFKQINDTHGHQAGDLALSELGTILLDALAEQQIAGRIGGEEFCLILPGSHAEHALDFAWQLVDDVAELRIQHGELTLSLTCSIGVASLQANEDSRLLLARADRALYDAKKAGRNRALAAP